VFLNPLKIAVVPNEEEEEFKDDPQLKAMMDEWNTGNQAKILHNNKTPI
jgi:uncharacterized protein YdeI (YjbR/CyaY-like superfamily)